MHPSTSSGRTDLLRVQSSLKLVWSQECITREEALSAERQIKGWSRKKKDVMIRGALIEIGAEVSRLAQSKSGHPSTGSGRTDLLLRAPVEG
jgi:putative endonuclease